MTSRSVFCLSYVLLSVICIFCFVRYNNCGKACITLLQLCYGILSAHAFLGALKYAGSEGAYPIVDNLHSVTILMVPLLAIPSATVFAIPKKLCGKRELATALALLQFLPSTVFLIKGTSVDELVIEIEVLTNIITLTGLGIHYKDFNLFGACAFYTVGHYSGKCSNMSSIEDELCITFGLCGFSMLMLMYAVGVCSPFKL